MAITECTRVLRGCSRTPKTDVILHPWHGKKNQQTKHIATASESPYSREVSPLLTNGGV